MIKDHLHKPKTEEKRNIRFFYYFRKAEFLLLRLEMRIF